MEEELNLLKMELQQKSIKMTRQRKEILRLFLTQTHHLFTASEIQQQLVEEGHQMDLSTIYRNLEILASAGVLRHIALNDNIARYELITEHHHHHLICLGCNKTEIIDLCPFQEINRYVTTQTDFLPTEHRFEIYGYCKDCQENNRSTGDDAFQGRKPHDHSGY